MKKIMFNDKFGLTDAVLDRIKTQTRRVIKLDIIKVYDAYAFTEVARKTIEKSLIAKYSKYKVGELVAVAQSYADLGFGCPPIISNDENDMPEFASEAGVYNKMFVRADLMPHQIRITNVRVERLQDISDEDCIKEGIGISATDNRIGYPIGIPFNYFIGEDKKGCRYSTPREAYAALIDKISGKGTWECNPYVFVYDFELFK